MAKDNLLNIYKNMNKRSSIKFHINDKKLQKAKMKGKPLPQINQSSDDEQEEEDEMISDSS